MKVCNKKLNNKKIKKVDSLFPTIKTIIMSRKCGVCQVTGHTVRGCSDAGAGVALADLMSENNLERAKALCQSMPPRYVSFALCHGFGVAVSLQENRVVATSKPRRILVIVV